MMECVLLSREKENGQEPLEGQNEKLQDVEHALRERLKELNCLYEISRLVESRGGSLAEILQGAVDLIPPSWQYPETCHARLTVEDEEYITADFQASARKQSADIFVKGASVGMLEVFYLRETPQFEEGPFLKEERDLLNAIAERAGKVIERIQCERRREIDRHELRDANTALRRVLLQIEEEKKDWNDSVSANVDKVIMPMLRDLEDKIPDHLRQHVSLLKKQLGSLTSPFVNRLSSSYAALTPAEIEICNMIRDGFATKEMARVRHVSRATIAKQRERIRKKLHVSGTTTNLGTHLRMLASGNSDTASC